VAVARNRITIRRPIDDVFAVLTDVEKTGTWFPGNVREEWTSPAPHGVGATRHAIVKVLGRQTENDAVATEFDPPRRAAMRGTSPNAPFLVTLDFSTTGDGTQVDVTSEIGLRGSARVFGPLVVSVYGLAWGRGLRKLKTLMESGQL
jgi:carbon monoxide dehydrogenase subunit G